MRKVQRSVEEYGEEQVKFLRNKRKLAPSKESQEDVTFRSWPLGVKGKITREEIYDYL